MADMEEKERFCHDLLVQLKKTTECLLAANSAQGVWGTYGGLRRVCSDAEAILSHRIKQSRASSESDGSFWQFVQGLKWLCPNLAPVIDKLNRHTQSRKGVGAEMGRDWLRESVEDHTLMPQLDILISDNNHLQSFYHDDAFLRQPDCVKAMRIFFKAIELGKPALLSEISPNLLRSGPASSFNSSRKSSVSVGRAVRPTGAGQHVPAGCFDPSTGTSQISVMGNRHPHLNVTYSNQLNNSNLSLAVDPSLGASSLLHQKALSDPYFVSSIDSPRALDSFARDPFSEALRHRHFASHQQGLQQNSQSAFGHAGQSGFGHTSQSALGPGDQSDFEHSSQSGFGHGNQSDFEQSGQSAFGPGDQSDFEQSSQSALGPADQSDFEHSGLSAFGYSSQFGFKHLSESTFDRLSQSSYEPPSQSSFTSDSQSFLDSYNQFHAAPEDGSTVDLSKTSHPQADSHSDYPPKLVAASNSSVDYYVPETRSRTSTKNEDADNTPVNPYSQPKLVAASNSSVDYYVPETRSRTSTKNEDADNTPVNPYSQPKLVAASNSSVDYYVPETRSRTFTKNEDADNTPVNPYLVWVINSATASHPSPSNEIPDSTSASSRANTERTDRQEKGGHEHIHTPAHPQDHIANPSDVSQEIIADNVPSMRLSCAENYAKLNLIDRVPKNDFFSTQYFHENRRIEVGIPQKDCVNIDVPGTTPDSSLFNFAFDSAALANFSDNSNRTFDHNLMGATSTPVIDATSTPVIGATSTPANNQNVPTNSSKTEIRINILPETPTLPRNHSYSSGINHLKQRNISLSEPDNLQPKIISVRSDPSINITHPLTSLGDNSARVNSQFSNPESQVSDPGSPAGPWADVDFYDKDSPCTSPISKTFSGTLRSSGNVYIPQPLHPGMSSLSPPAAAHSSALHKLSTSISQQAPAAPPRKLGHKRWVSDTSTIRVDKLHQADIVAPQASLSKPASEQKTEVSKQNGQPRRRASEFEPPLYQGNLTKPTEGQSLMSYLTSQDFNTCANLEKENAHFRICEALIEAFESMKFNRMMRRQETGKANSSSDSSSDEEIQELRQRIRIRKREKMMAKVQSFPSLSDDQTDTATTSQTASSPVSSKNDFSSMSGDSESDDGKDNEKNIDMTMSSDNQSNLTVVRSSGLNLSMASLYSDAELQRSNLQIEKHSSHDESITAGSAESIAISLLRKFSEKHLPKASELKWLVSECDAPQRLLPLPHSTPVSPDDAENADLSTNRTRLRGNLEWAPPRAQIIFSIHPTEKRAVQMRRQNFRCAGCGMRVDPAFMKRYRYCAYLGKYFCQCCHTGETSIIPGRVIEKWDFSRYPIANFSYSLLEKMWREPLFHVNTINPGLYKRVRGLESIRECRQQLSYLHSLLAVCKRDAGLLTEISKMPSHWISNDDAYSMEDFTQVKNWTMLNHIKSFIAAAVAHVNDCQLCQGLGFICGMCHDQQVIFPFQLESVIKCQVCQACYHKDCFIPGKCPKCIRLEARRKLQQEPLSPDSPESAESYDIEVSSQNVAADGSAL